MSNKFEYFKPIDFIGAVSSSQIHLAANAANEKLNALIESWPVVYAFKNETGYLWFDESDTSGI